MLTSHPFNNVTENIFAKIGANLHRRPDHPICIIKEAIYAFFDERCPGVFTKFDDLHPVVSARAVGLPSLTSALPTMRRASLMINPACCPSFPSLLGRHKPVS